MKGTVLSFYLFIAPGRQEPYDTEQAEVTEPQLLMSAGEHLLLPSDS